MLYPGALYIDGNISGYIAIYFRVGKSRTSNLLPTSLTFGCLVLPLGTYFIQRGANPKLMLLLGACLGLTMNMIASITTNYSVFFWMYSLSWSINQGISYMVPVHHGWLWFPESPGLVSGLVIGGFGLGALVFDNVSTLIINPNNIQEGELDYKSTISSRFVKMLHYLQLSYAFLALLGVALIFSGPKKEHHPYFRQ